MLNPELKEQLLKLIYARAPKEQIEKILGKIPEKNCAEFLNSCFALHAAVSRAQVDVVKLLIGKGADVNLLKPAHGSPLHVAITQVNQFMDTKHKQDQQPQIVRLLIEAGANVNIKDKDSGDTPLHWVFSRGASFDHSEPQYKDYCEIAKLLIENGADRYAKNNNDKFPEFYNRNFKNLLDELMKNKSETNKKSEKGESEENEVSESMIQFRR